MEVLLGSKQADACITEEALVMVGVLLVSFQAGSAGEQTWTLVTRLVCHVVGLSLVGLSEENLHNISQDS